MSLFLVWQPEAGETVLDAKDIEADEPERAARELGEKRYWRGDPTEWQYFVVQDEDGERVSVEVHARASIEFDTEVCRHRRVGRTGYCNNCLISVQSLERGGA